MKAVLDPLHWSFHQSKSKDGWKFSMFICIDPSFMRLVEESYASLWENTRVFCEFVELQTITMVFKDPLTTLDTSLRSVSKEAHKTHEWTRNYTPHVGDLSIISCFDWISKGITSDPALALSCCNKTDVFGSLGDLVNLHALSSPFYTKQTKQHIHSDTPTH